mmetsp:Transcript_8823/g.19602  ORF Transcript_8823/g.19602 Transcript_8823/m.19602 type:complete len:233 (+) Transcript_8823:80-778(+)|eukprot:CAMPEP_0206459378 /NCGR_PEP_ID=MMETSP0324_2-20121206/24137_1 /ASSEMBLY_ACC=CAM_ASM_000836 /TAXON_ID=2866 /ORGANISM="Crypthecodinium cohnii, Strain Seligo" /LENGTH=232 /DNA_ID=CAMNT_0053930911 /DNA_START=80 /DNA_END=778 /DNA_ORIENTATION=+
MGQSACKACGHSDPTTDTVKVNPTLLAEAEVTGPGKIKTANAAATETHRATDAQEQQRSLEEQQERARLEAEKKAKEEEERQAEARRQRIREAEEAQRAKEVAEAAERKEREEREQREKAEADRLAREAAEEQRKAVEAKAKEELAAALKKVEAFLKAKGFKSLDAPRKKMMTSSCMPLHVAVQEKDEDMVKALLLCGANKTTPNSAKKTPLEVAQKLNKKGSHDIIIALLS